MRLQESRPLPSSQVPGPDPLSLQLPQRKQNVDKAMSAFPSPTQLNLYTAKEPLSCFTDSGDFPPLEELLDQTVLEFGIVLDQKIPPFPHFRGFVRVFSQVR